MEELPEILVSGRNFTFETPSVQAILPMPFGQETGRRHSRLDVRFFPEIEFQDSRAYVAILLT
jgi:hypothetical protein